MKNSNDQEDDYGIIDAGELIPEPEIPETEMDWIREMKAMKIKFSKLSGFGEYGQSVRIYIGYCHKLLDPLFKRYQNQKRNSRSAGKNSAEVRRNKAVSVKDKFQEFYREKKAQKLDNKISDSNLIDQFRRINPGSPSKNTLRKYLPKK